MCRKMFLWDSHCIGLFYFLFSRIRPKIHTHSMMPKECSSCGRCNEKFKLHISKKIHWKTLKKWTARTHWTISFTCYLPLHRLCYQPAEERQKRTCSQTFCFFYSYVVLTTENNTKYSIFKAEKQQHKGKLDADLVRMWSERVARWQPTSELRRESITMPITVIHLQKTHVFHHNVCFLVNVRCAHSILRSVLYYRSFTTKPHFSFSISVS